MPKLQRLKHLRTARMLSQRDLAEKSGVSQNTIVRIENGEDARYVTARKLALALGVEAFELTEAEDTKAAA